MNLFFIKRVNEELLNYDNYLEDQGSILFECEKILL